MESDLKNSQKYKKHITSLCNFNRPKGQEKYWLINIIKGLLGYQANGYKIIDFKRVKLDKWKAVEVLINEVCPQQHSNFREYFQDWIKKNPSNRLSKKNPIQVGRPEDFPSVHTKTWYNELKHEENFQHKNGKPHKTKIKEKIIEKHRELRGDGETPSMATIDNHFRKLRLTKK